MGVYRKCLHDNWGYREGLLTLQDRFPRRDICDCRSTGSRCQRYMYHSNQDSGPVFIFHIHIIIHINSALIFVIHIYIHNSYSHSYFVSHLCVCKCKNLCVRGAGVAPVVSWVTWRVLQTEAGLVTLSHAALGLSVHSSYRLNSSILWKWLRGGEGLENIYLHRPTITLPIDLPLPYL